MSQKAANWIGTWASAQVQPAATGLSAAGFTNQTVRNIVHTSVGGSALRIRISNVFGKTPLVVSATQVALSASGAATVTGSTKPVLFAGSTSVTIPPGVRQFSDPVEKAIGAGTNLAVSLYFQNPTGPATWHQNAIGTNYYSTAGDHSADATATAYTNPVTSWFFLDGVDVLNSAVEGAVVTFGASTTDGVGSTPGAAKRYPDDLARRLTKLPWGQRLSVLNAGIAGNVLLADGGTNGQSALDRFQRDVLEQSGVQTVIIWEGSNDIGAHPSLPLTDLTGAYEQLIAIARTRGIKVIGATLQPDKGASFWTPQGAVLRVAVNNWILSSGAFDGTIDFSKVLKNPADTDAILPAYDSGDHLHPNDVGYQAMANSVDLSLLRPAAATKPPAPAPKPKPPALAAPAGKTTPPPPPP